MERIILIGLAALVLSACGNKQFVKKPEQSQDQFRNDMNYCKGEALGAWDDRNGVSQINLRSQTSGQMSYEDCMLQMGYEQAR
ncbi:hypothetical protein [Thiomicrospira sp. S5]|jgi:hypothetical protein|uniref:hypothetical protein n=1 Tax=Thiomicrospira sp. S5 TaxID=1803865 RepID=UPI000F8A1769|nr:hypothetical protein [Thiomicrospira sp. S5]AZR80850.1 hypothetical protein AYJ59_00220 [Thiomicrospira sp. S5]